MLFCDAPKTTYPLSQHQILEAPSSIVNLKHFHKVFLTPGRFSAALDDIVLFKMSSYLRPLSEASDCVYSTSRQQ